MVETVELKEVNIYNFKASDIVRGLNGWSLILKKGYTLLHNHLQYKVKNLYYYWRADEWIIAESLLDHGNTRKVIRLGDL